MSIKILLADDHQIMCDGLSNLIEKQTNMEVIAVVDNGRKAVRLAKEMNPDVVIMDVTMPELNGIEATRQISAEISSVKVIALSMHSDKRFVAKMLSAGASGYILKECAVKELVEAIHAVVTNRRYLSSKVAEIVTEEYIRQLPEDDSSPYCNLTAREREVLQLMSEGKTTKKIASCLYVSVKTVEAHRKNIMDKLNVHNVAGLVKYAIREGLTPL